MGLLRVALRIELENPVLLVHSCVHDRLRPREMIGFNDNLLSSWSVICGRFELYLRWRTIGKC